MDASKPLAYESLKTVLQYMEPNLRFKVARRVPSIASTERLLPLKINKLEFHPYKFVVNDTSYRLGTYRHYPPGVEPLRGHLENNSEGGVPFDLDQYGFVNYSHQNKRTAGDVVIRDARNGNRRRPYTVEDEWWCLSQKYVLKWILAKRSGYNVAPLSKNHEHFHLVQQYQHRSTETIKIRIDRLEAALAPFHCRNMNVHYPYFAVAQLTVENPNRKEEIFRKPDIKLYKAEKELTTRLVGNRKGNVFVKKLKIEFWPQGAAQMVIRLPPDLQIKVREMCVLRNTIAVCNAIKSLIHSSSYPLERIQVSNSTHRLTVHPTVFNAKRLIFRENSTFEGGMDEFLQFPNPWIYLCQNMFTSDQHITLLRSWIENQREVGTCFVSKFTEETIITEIFEKCKEELNGSGGGKWFVKVPMSNSSEINMHYKLLKKRDHWMLTIKVVAV